MNNFDGIIFDIDGTLASTNDLICASFNHVAGIYLDRQFTWKEIQNLFGPTEDVILNDLMKDSFKDAQSDYYEFYTDQHNSLAGLYPGMRELIKGLKNKGVLLSIYTGKGRQSSEITLKKTGIYEYFDMIVTGDDIPGQKPSPVGVEMFLSEYNLNKDKVIMIGDAPADVKAARNAGIKVAAVLWDSYAKEKVLEMNSDFVFHSVGELASFLTN
jgi:HAD superfamily hydrolase (TIGR01549 family)